MARTAIHGLLPLLSPSTDPAGDGLYEPETAAARCIDELADHVLGHFRSLAALAAAEHSRGHSVNAAAVLPVGTVAGGVLPEWVPSTARGGAGGEPEDLGAGSGGLTAAAAARLLSRRAAHVAALLSTPDGSVPAALLHLGAPPPLLLLSAHGQPDDSEVPAAAAALSGYRPAPLAVAARAPAEAPVPAYKLPRGEAEVEVAAAAAATEEGELPAAGTGDAAEAPSGRPPLLPPLRVAGDAELPGGSGLAGTVTAMLPTPRVHVRSGAVAAASSLFALPAHSSHIPVAAQAALASARALESSHMQAPGDKPTQRVLESLAAAAVGGPEGAGGDGASPRVSRWRPTRPTSQAATALSSAVGGRGASVPPPSTTPRVGGAAPRGFFEPGAEEDDAASPRRPQSAGSTAGRRGVGAMARLRAANTPARSQALPQAFVADPRVVERLCADTAASPGALDALRPVFLAYCRLEDPGNTGARGPVVGVCPFLATTPPTPAAAGRMSHTNFYKLLRDMGVMEGGAAGQGGRGGGGTLSAGIVHLHLSLIARDNTADGHARTKVRGGAPRVPRTRQPSTLHVLLAGVPARVGPGYLPARQASCPPCKRCGSRLHPRAGARGRG